MEERKWEDLNADCLANVFGRVGMESLTLDIPLVCKSWYKATLIPSCWQHLVLPHISANKRCNPSRIMAEHRGNGEFPVTSFVKYVVNRSHGSATKFEIPSRFGEEALLYMAENCPALKTLEVARYVNYDPIPNLICKWKDLEELVLHGSANMIKIMTQTSIHCNKLVSFSVEGADIYEKEASAIVTLLPNIKKLSLRYGYMERKSLVIILMGCRELVYFDVNGYGDFEWDDEVIFLASHITTFKYKGSRSTFNYKGSRSTFNLDYDDEYSSEGSVDLHDDDLVSEVSFDLEDYLERWDID